MALTTVVVVQSKATSRPWGGGGVLPSKRLMGMCRLMRSHFHGWIDNNGFAFSLELLKWDCIFSGFGGSESSGR